ncbi:MAG: sulfide/dihydroorotate dehydrogenase-like FAD/NAD-binding protein, partial [Alphaproteobacteria bacterium]|nr:sulfide/dihydroorotate dehydrogenase-like FAD/NAD-binding protein [Alphaproteobacteria bacterium]
MTVGTRRCGDYGSGKSAAEEPAGALAHHDAGPGIAPYEILAREDFSDVTYLLQVSHPMMARAAKPGQFVIVISREGGERIPLTIADFDSERGSITLVIQAAGKTTREMQQTCQVGTHLHSMVGPLGEPSHIGAGGKVVCVGGGLGVAPVFPQARAFKQNGAYVIGVVGFRNNDLVFWRDKFESVCDEFIICSDDGSVGIKGLVTDGIEMAVAKHDDINEVIAIGPPIMM